MLICPESTYTTELGKVMDGYTGKMLTPYLKKLLCNGCLSWTLLCACRVDTDLHQKVCEFFQKLPDNDNSRHRLHMEIAWPTIAKMSGGSISTFNTNRFQVDKIPYDFNDYRNATPYHAVKTDIKWMEIMNRSQRNANERYETRKTEICGQSDAISKSGSRTAVLFISHIVDNEMIDRYCFLKQGCDEMGYDLFWAMDADSSFKDYVPSEIQKFEFSYDEYEKEFPNQVFFYKRKYNMTPSVPNLFYLHNRGKYDYIWVVEYDVCCYGKWSQFFK